MDIEQIKKEFEKNWQNGYESGYQRGLVMGKAQKEVEMLERINCRCQDEIENREPESYCHKCERVIQGEDNALCAECSGESKME